MDEANLDELQKFGDTLLGPAVGAVVGSACTYVVARTLNRSNQTRPLVFEEIVIPLMDLLRRGDDNVFQIEQIADRSEMLYLSRRLAAQIKKYLDLLFEARAAASDFDRAVSRHFARLVEGRGIPFTTSPTRGSWQMQHVGSRWLADDFNTDVALYASEGDSKQGPTAPYALTGGGAPSYEFYIYEDDVQAKLGQLRAAAHRLRQDLAADTHQGEITQLWRKIDRERDKLLKRLSKV